MQIDFVKCHGSGNDFPMIDARGLDLPGETWAQLARVLADRAGPVGGDGILLLTPGDDTAAFGMRMLNSDGSEAETCLNGLRCVARMGFAALALDRAEVRLKTSRASVERDADLAAGVYTIGETAGPADLDASAWPIAGASRIVDQPVFMLPSARLFTAVAMPNPHLVSFVEAIDEAELSALGAVCEAAPAWLPNRANVSFVEVRGENALFVRTFERGVGLTDSCGSAMAASSFAACLTGRMHYGAALTVFNRGGLVRAVVQPDAMVRLSGNATYEWAGSIDFDPASGALGALHVTQRFDAEIAAWGAAKTIA